MKSELDLEHIEALLEQYVNGFVPPFMVTGYIPALIAEIRKLRAQIHDMGLPDANDFPEVPNKWGGL